MSNRGLTIAQAKEKNNAILREKSIAHVGKVFLALVGAFRSIDGGELAVKSFVIVNWISARKNAFDKSKLVPSKIPLSSSLQNSIPPPLIDKILSSFNVRDNFEFKNDSNQNLTSLPLHPKVLLNDLVTKKLKMERPVPRMIAESGRVSNNSIFMVGYYSGISKLGEGVGKSIKIAETNAAIDALRKYYLKEPPV